MIYDVATYTLALATSRRVMVVSRCDAAVSEQNATTLIARTLKSDAIINQYLPSQRYLTVVWPQTNSDNTYPDKLYEIDWQDDREL